MFLLVAGKPIVPISYGNNAKSANLTGGTKTISMEVATVSRSKAVRFQKVPVMGGAQSPSVSVTEDRQGTYTVDLYLSYSDGEPVQGSAYTLTDQSKL